MVVTDNSFSSYWDTYCHMQYFSSMSTSKSNGSKLGLHECWTVLLMTRSRQWLCWDLVIGQKCEVTVQGSDENMFQLFVSNEFTHMMSSKSRWHIISSLRVKAPLLSKVQCIVSQCPNFESRLGDWSIQTRTHSTLLVTIVSAVHSLLLQGRWCSSLQEASSYLSRL